VTHAVKPDGPEHAVHPDGQEHVPPTQIAPGGHTGQTGTATVPVALTPLTEPVLMSEPELISIDPLAAPALPPLAVPAAFAPLPPVVPVPALAVVRPPQPTASTATHAAKRNAPRTGRLIPQGDTAFRVRHPSGWSPLTFRPG
jgi:hypothetical protein